MEIVNFLVENGPWSWIVGGLVLLALELVLPGGFLLWMGIAGILTGIITLFQPLAWPMQWLIFGRVLAGLHLCLGAPDQASRGPRPIGLC